MLVTCLAFGLVAFFATITITIKSLDPISKAIEEFSFADVYSSIMEQTGTRDTSMSITIVDMTELTNRAQIARVLTDIEKCNPKVVGVDVCFDVEGEDFASNDSLIQVAETYKNIVWGNKLLDYGDSDSIGYTKCISSFFTEYTEVTEGCVNSPRGSLHDNIKRKMPIWTLYNAKPQLSIAAQIANKFAEKDITSSDKELINVNFTPTEFRKIKPEEVLSHPENIEGQIVLFGALYEDVDMHWTPVGRIAGVELVAYTVETIINNIEIIIVPDFELYIISFLIVILVQILQSSYIERTSKSRFIFVKYIIGSSYILGIVTFLFTSVFIGLGFMAFQLFNVSFNLGWALSVVAFLGTSRNMYNALKDYFVNR